MSKISPKLETLIDHSRVDDGKIDTAESVAIAKATPRKQCAAVAQRLMDDGFSGSSADLQKVAKLLGRTDMPSTDFTVRLQKASRQTIVTHVEVDGVTFKIAVRERQHINPAELKKIAKAVNDANAMIKDPKQQVHEVAIANGATTRMATFDKKPILVLAPELATGATATHEAGHAVFEAIRKSKTGQDTLLRVADIYSRLMATKDTEATTRATDGTTQKETAASGMWPFDPSQWSKTISSEHPHQDPDEFFASALEAYKTDRKGLEAAIAKFAKKDPAGAAPAKEMLKLLDELTKGDAVTPPKLGGDEKKAAEAKLGQIKDPSVVEDTIDSMLNEALSLALKPEQIK